MTDGQTEWIPGVDTFTTLYYLFQMSGLSDWLGLQMAVLQVIPSWALVAIILLLLSFVTEFTSNVACTAIVLPILAEMVTIAHIFLGATLVTS